MASALMTFRDQGGEKIALEKDASAARGREDESRAEREAMAHDQQAKAEQAVAVLGYGLKRLAEGDLAYRIQTVLYPAAEPLRFDYNTSAEKLRVVMSSIADAIISIRANSHEVSDASEAFSQRLEQQAASLEQTAAAIDHITQTVKHTAEASAVVNATAAQATAEARQGNLKVEATVNTIHDIARSSEKISTIIGVIDEIAFQTNLLALNAGVEAARAGDSGRGFAVVASEVRALAQRSADAAKEIKGLIASAQGNVENGVKRAGEAGGTIARLLAQITEVQTLTTDIAASAKEQAAGAHEVNIAVNTMDQTTQQNAAMVEETTAASRAMAAEAAALAELVGSFKLGGENGSALVRAA
ncbi:MAG: mcpA [Hyphomicrobiales bacterium]|nr:mcpA [Hyphomicrobiales bacterium]